MKGRLPTGRRGMAIVIALFFAFCLMIMFIGMFFQQRSTASHNRLSNQNRQAFFAARAALQHFLLKAKLFPTELYDAVEFTVGKNPLFDFTEFPGHDKNNVAVFALRPQMPVYVRVKEELDINLKPKYFYIPVEGQDDVFIKIGSFYNPDFRFLGPGFAVSDPSQRYTHPQLPANTEKPGKYLEYFIRDCTNFEREQNGTKLQPSLIMNIAPDVDTARSWSIYTSQGYPYTMQYTVNSVNIQAMKELRRYNEEAIEIEVTGSIWDFQKKNFTQVQKKIQKITRRGAL